ncbi:MAG: hybrid sensor histidine kinase/response regulator [Desulfuromonadales bacterium]
MSTPLRLLIIEDSEDDALLLIRELAKNGYDPDCERVDTPEGMQSALAAGAWDVVVSDYVMPRFSGLAALRMLKESNRDIPFIIVSGNIGEVTAVEAMRAGAHDYILKGKLARLAPAIEREISEAENRRKRRQADEELAQLHKTLEARVVEMVTDMRRKDQILIQQSRLAAMGEMIGNIAHQWRNPLNNVALIIQSLQLDYDSGTLTGEIMHSDIREAMAALLHMSDTINEFRNFFRVDKEKREFCIEKSVNSAMTLVAASLSNNNIRIEIEGNDEVTAFGYQNEYAQTLLNIIANSREAALERTITDPHIFIRITCENGRSVLYVRDNCGGIPDEVLPKIFDPYFTTRGPDRGTGIGLYMSKVIIEQNMAGHLTACNVDGGAEFRIEV